MRRGPVYALRAADHAGQEVRVIVDARLGRIVRIVPAFGPHFAAPIVAPPPYGRPPGGIAMVPDGYGPNSRIAALPPGGEGPPENGPGLAGVPTGPGHAPAVGAAPRPAVQAGPPLPRPRPKLAATATDPSTSKPATGVAPQVSQSRQAGTKETTGAVTPPPEE
jgi:hypothetical protein